MHRISFDLIDHAFAARASQAADDEPSERAPHDAPDSPSRDDTSESSPSAISQADGSP